MTGQPFSFRDRLREIDRFFHGNDRIHQTMRQVAGKLDAAQIPYALVGGMAVNAHQFARTTADVDFLLTTEGLAAFVRLYVSQDFAPVPGRPRRFRDPANGVTFDVLLTGLFPGNGLPGPIAYPDPANVSETIDGTRVVRLPTLIELKLAAGRHKDFGDVVELIRIHGIDESFLPSLHQSVHGDFIVNHSFRPARRERDERGCSGTVSRRSQQALLSVRFIGSP